MSAHTEQEFNTFMSQLKETNQTLGFFCDFDKISQNVKNIEISLNMLNYLIGKPNIEEAVRDIWQRDKTAFNVMDILIAVRDDGKKKVIDSLGECVLLKNLFTSAEGVIEFLNETGLTSLFQSNRIKDLVDYVFGIETGLDSNARKNRSGHIMEDTVEDIFIENSVQYRKEVYSKEYPLLANALGDDEKRFDFVIETENKVYLIEVNFYSGGGSKLNEVARSYSDIAPKINAIEGFEFVWITDGYTIRSDKFRYVNESRTRQEKDPASGNGFAGSMDFGYSWGMQAYPPAIFTGVYDVDVYLRASEFPKGTSFKLVVHDNKRKKTVLIKNVPRSLVSGKKEFAKIALQNVELNETTYIGITGFNKKVTVPGKVYMEKVVIRKEKK